MGKSARIFSTLLIIAVALPTSSLTAATYYADPGKKGKMSNKGSSSKPWSTLEEIIKSGKLNRLKGGDRLVLRDGYHGTANFSGDNDKVITIEADEGALPQLSALYINKGKNWTVRGLCISPSYGKTPVKGTLVVIGEKGASENLVVENCFVSTAPDASGWSFQQWKSANTGMTQGRHGKKLVFRNNFVLNTRFGINLCAYDSLCEGNVVSDFSGDGIRVTRDGITVQHNVVKNAYCSMKEGDKNHDDAIQCFLFNKGTGTVRNLTIRSNIIINREDDKQKFQNSMQAIGFFDGPLINFLVEENVICVAHWHGVSLYDAQGCRILNNTAYSRWKNEKPKPWVQLGSKLKKTKGNTVTGNYAHSFRLSGDKSVKEKDNRKITEEIYKKRLKKLRKEIDEKFGKEHFAAGLYRLGNKAIKRAPAKKKMKQ